ncbi:MAG: hypothetical protein ACFFBU_01810 [Promethearchaeota archaeon]
MKPKIKYLLSLLLLGLFVMTFANIYGAFAWTEDCQDISDWTQANGDPAIDADNGGWHPSIAYNTIVYDSKFTPATPFSTGWWVSYPTSGWYDSKYAGIYRNLEVEESNNWEVEISIDFDNYSPGFYSHQGGYFVYLLNEQKQPMMQIYYSDGSGSSNEQRLNIRAYYYDTSGTQNVIYNPGAATARGVLGTWIIKNVDGHIQCFWPMATTGSVPGTGSWHDLTEIANGEDLLQRGTLTYLLIMQRSRYRAPTTAYITAVQVDDNVEVEPPEWYQANGDSDIDGDHGGWHTSIGYSHIPYLDYYAPSTPPNQGWWISYPTSGYQNNRYSGVYRPLNVIENAYWELKVGIDFNNYATGTYSYQGGFNIYLLNEQKEPMLQIAYWDGSGSSYEHYLAIRAYYYDTAGVEHLFYNPGSTANAYNVVGEIEIQRIANHIYCYYPTATTGSVPGTGVWLDLTALADGTDLLQRGTMTYLLVMQRSRYRAPTTAYITSFEEAGSDPEPQYNPISSDFFSSQDLSDMWTINELQSPTWPMYTEPFYSRLTFAATPRDYEPYMNGWEVSQEDLAEPGYFSIETIMEWWDITGGGQYVDFNIYLVDDNYQIVGRVRFVYNEYGRRFELSAGYGPNKETLIVEWGPGGHPIEYANHLDIRMFRLPSNPDQITVEADYDDLYSDPMTYTVQGLCDTTIAELTINMRARQLSGNAHFKGYVYPIRVEPICALKYPDKDTGDPFQDPIVNNDFELSVLSSWIEDPNGAGERSSDEHLWNDHSWYISDSNQIATYNLSQQLTEDEDFTLDTIKQQQIAFSFHAHGAETSSVMRAAITYWDYDGKRTRIFGEWTHLSDSSFTTISVVTQSPIPERLMGIMVSIEGRAYQGEYFSAYIDAARLTIKQNNAYGLYITGGNGLISVGITVIEAHADNGEATLTILPVVYAEATTVGGPLQVHRIMIKFDVLEMGTADVFGWPESPGCIQSNDKNWVLPGAEEVQAYNAGVEAIATILQKLASTGASLAFPGLGTVASLLIDSGISIGFDFAADVFKLPVPEEQDDATVGDPGYMEWIYPYYPGIPELQTQAAEGALRLNCGYTTAGGNGGFFTLRITFYASFTDDTYAGWEMQSILLMIPA